MCQQAVKGTKNEALLYKNMAVKQIKHKEENQGNNIVMND